MATRMWDAHRLRGRTVYANDGDKLGKVDDVLVDAEGAPRFVEVTSGWFRTKRHVVPIDEMGESGDDLTAPYTKRQLEDAPTFDEGEEIDYDRERAIGSHYGRPVRDWDDARDRGLGGEDLSRGPTPETRHPRGGRDDVHDTTEGPTPETRRADRAAERDRDTRGGIGEPDRLNRDPERTYQDRERDPEPLGDAGTMTGERRRVRLRRWEER